MDDTSNDRLTDPRCSRLKSSQNSVFSLKSPFVALFDAFSLLIIPNADLLANMLWFRQSRYHNVHSLRELSPAKCMSSFVIHQLKLTLSYATLLCLIMG